MLLAEVARQEGLFDWLAARAARRAEGSATRLFAARLRRRHAGHGVAVQRRHRRGADAGGGGRGEDARQGEEPLPYLFICAFIANAASFVLPISNPANLVVYGSHMPPLLHWLPLFALPSVLAIVATYRRAALDPAPRLREPVVDRRSMSPALTLRRRAGGARASR